MQSLLARLSKGDLRTRAEVRRRGRDRNGGPRTAPHQTMDGVQRSLARLYQRWGPRVIWAYYVAAMAMAIVVTLFGTWALALYLEMTSAELLVQLAVSVLAALVAIGIVLATTHDHTQAILSWSDAERTHEAALGAWADVADTPRVIMRHVGPVAGALTALVGVFAVINVDAPAWAAAPVVIAGELGTLGSLVVVAFACELGLRPMLAEISPYLPPDFRPDHTWSVRWKVLAPLPLLTMGAAMAVGAFADASSTGYVRLAVVLLVAAAIVVVVSTFFFVVTRSALDPIGDLTQATRRVGQGDLAAAVPVVTGDELGTLSASFNRMLEGLREREGLREEVLRREEELRASRARIVAASDAERRRVERNIHDGAQQELVALAVKLRLLEDRVDDDTELRAAIGELGARLRRALEDLRELARGLHPSVLTTDGLSPALQQLGSRAPLDVSVSAPADRFPEAIESTAYFVASEALANVAKYAQATHAQVLVEPSDGRLVIEIADDGIGGARADSGSGLMGLVDRVAALEGRLTVDSPGGQGTTVRAELPLT